MTMPFGRVLRTGLLGKARALFHGLGPKGEHPSRKDWTPLPTGATNQPTTRAEERCELCRFWETNGYGGVGGPHCDGSASNCRRHAPQHIAPERYPSANVRWVTTNRNDWCGDFEPR
jgi:hypothetical protein